jgi:hypothetical protein
MLAAGIGLYMLLADREPGAEIYSGATSEKQAWETFRPAKDMLTKTPAAINYFGVEVFAKSISSAKTGSRFEPVIGKPGDGSSPHCCLVDEYHEHDTPDLYNTMETGMGAREQPLMLVITTAGFNLAGPCFEKETEVKRVLDGVIDNPELFGMIYGIDDDDDWSNPASLRKANLFAESTQSKASPPALHSMLRPHAESALAEGILPSSLPLRCSVRRQPGRCHSMVPVAELRFADAHHRLGSRRWWPLRRGTRRRCQDAPRFPLPAQEDLNRRGVRHHRRRVHAPRPSRSQSQRLRSQGHDHAEFGLRRRGQVRVVVHP